MRLAAKMFVIEICNKCFIDFNCFFVFLQNTTIKLKQNLSNHNKMMKIECKHAISGIFCLIKNVDEVGAGAIWVCFRFLHN